MAEGHCTYKNPTMPQSSPIHPLPLTVVVVTHIADTLKCVRKPSSSSLLA